MRLNPHARARYNMIEAANALHMPLGALGEHAKRGDIQVDFDHGYNFIAVGEVERFRGVRREEAAAARVAEQERVDQERREHDGAHIAREISRLRELAEKHGYDPSVEG